MKKGFALIMSMYRDLRILKCAISKFFESHIEPARIELLTCSVSIEEH